MAESRLIVNNVVIHYQRFGKGRRALVVPNAVWLADDFAELVKDRTVIFFDPRGRGRSGAVPDKTKISLESEIEDLDSVIRHCELEQVVLFGWSYHGGVVAGYAARHPDAVLRVIQSGPISPRRAPHYVQAMATYQSRLDMQAITELMKAPPSDPMEACKAFGAVGLRGHFVDPAARERSLARPCEHENEWPQNVMANLNAFLSSAGEWDWRSVGAAYDGPVLIVHGDGDFLPLEGSREWQGSFRNARLVVPPSSGHFPWLEQKEMFFRWMNEFLGDADLNHWSWPG